MRRVPQRPSEGQKTQISRELAMAVINLPTATFPDVFGTASGDIILSIVDPGISGSGGNQTLYGGLGSDTYVINHATLDVIVEFLGEGVDLVILTSGVTGAFGLAANVENLTDR